MTRRRPIVLLMVAALLLLSASVALGQEPSGLDRFFSRIGSVVRAVVMPLILAVSLAMVYFVFEGFYLLRRSLLLPVDLIGRVHELFRERRYQEALDLCRNNDSLFARMVRAGLGKLRWGHAAMVKAMEDAGREMSVGLFHRIGNLSLVASVAPMLGLLGTVSGMIVAFNRIAAVTDEPVTPAMVADGIRYALNTTAAGLLVAIPALIAHNYMRDRLVRIVLEAQAVGEEILLPFKRMEEGGSGGSEKSTPSGSSDPKTITRVRPGGPKRS